MPLENATYIHQLDPSNPAGTDQIAQGDDHIRMIKAALKATFPNINAPVTKTDEELNAAAFAMPVGAIVAWYGSSGSVPSGWALCNGQTVALSAGGGTIATPDLRDRFIVGAGTAIAAFGATAGSATASANTGVAGNHGHALSGGGDHTHSISLTETTAPAYLTTSSRSVDGDTSPPAQVLQSATLTLEPHTHSASLGSATHTHDIGAAGDHQHSVSVSTIPPSIGLHYIMKV